MQKFLDYAHDWWNDFKTIRQSHKNRLVKIFAETDDRESSVYKPVCSLIGPMMADRLIESPLHAARFVSLIPFHRMETPGAEKVEVWHSMQSFLSRVSSDDSFSFVTNLVDLYFFFNRVVVIQRTMRSCFATYCSALASKPTYASVPIVRAHTPGS